MRDAVAAIVAAALIFFALSLLTSSALLSKASPEGARGRARPRAQHHRRAADRSGADALHRRRRTLLLRRDADRQERDHGGARADQRLANRRVRVAAGGSRRSTFSRRRSTIGPKASRATAGTWPSRRSILSREPFSSSAAPCASACLRSSHGKSSTRSDSIWKNDADRPFDAAQGRLPLDFRLAGPMIDDARDRRTGDRTGD